LRLFTSQLVGRFINGIRLIRQRSDGKVVAIQPEFQKEIALLEQLTWCYVIEAPGLALQQYAQRQIIASLYKIFLNEAESPSPSQLATTWRETTQLVGFAYPETPRPLSSKPDTRSRRTEHGPTAALNSCQLHIEDSGIRPAIGDLWYEVNASECWQ
jgi:hypothetical protein